MNVRDGTVTLLLTRIAGGDSQAENCLLRLVYRELKSVAAHRLRSPRPGHTLTPTVLVHEAFLRVFRGRGAPLVNRKHLFFALGQAMWRIVVEHHRRRRLRGIAMDLEDLTHSSTAPGDDLLDIDEALAQLKHKHPREHEVVILRKAMGLSIPETAEVMETSTATVKRRWAFAKAVLSRHLSEGTGNGSRPRRADQGTVPQGHRA